MSLASKSGTALVIGAGGGLRRTLLTEWQAEADIDTVIGVSRQPPVTSSQAAQPGIKWIQSNYSEASISRVCICNGLLHNGDIWPEKRLEDVQADALQQVFHVNAVIPLLWIKSLITQLRGKHKCVVSVFSARFVARHLVDIMKQQHADGELSFVDWKNESIIW